MDNIEKAQRIVDEIIRVDYNDSLSDFLEENEISYQQAEMQVFFWLEDGYGDGLDVTTCRLIYGL